MPRPAASKRPAGAPPPSGRSPIRSPRVRKSTVRPPQFHEPTTRPPQSALDHQPAGIRRSWSMSALLERGATPRSLDCRLAFRDRAVRMPDMGGFGLRSRSPHPLDQVTFVENDPSSGRRDAIFNETEASPEPPPPTRLRKTGEKDCSTAFGFIADSGRGGATGFARSADRSSKPRVDQGARTNHAPRSLGENRPRPAPTGRMAVPWRALNGGQH